MTAIFKKINPYLLLLIILFVAYLPLSSFYFGMKNDAFSDNFPDKYFLSEAVRNGIFPLWNPYMNFGFPIYADPGFAYWNPVTWLFALIGYNAYTLTVEVLCYIYIGGVCMYNAGRYLKFPSNTALTVAAMYMCSGFFVGSIQYINFITAAAFLPFLLQSFLQLFQYPSVKYSAKFSLAFYCVLMSGHPAIPLASSYLIIILFIIFCFTYCKDENFHFKKIISYFIISVIFLVLLALPIIYSYAAIWKFYGRNAIHQSFKITSTGLDFSSFISLIFPFSTTPHSKLFTNDVAMRNLYFSGIGLISMLFAFKQKNKLITAFFFAGIIMLVLSFGGNFKTSLYNFLPGLNYVRANGEFRVFPILLFSLISGFGIKAIINNKNYAVLFEKIIKGLVVIISLLFVLLIVIYKNNLAEFITNLKNSGDSLAAVKFFLDNENFLIAFLISLFITIIVCIPVFIFNINSAKNFLLIVVAGLIINTIIYLPVTGVGTKTVAKIQAIYNSYPQGFPVPQLIPVNNIDISDARTNGLVGDLTYYNKKIGTSKLTNYPSYFRSTDSFFKSSQKEFVLSQPYIFFKSGNQNFQVKNFSPQKIVISVESDVADSLFLLQNQYKFWKAFNNKKEIPIVKAFISFMCVPMEKGANEIEFVYYDANLKYVFFISCITVIILLIIIFKKQN
ncbi:MAG: hypothetical protein M3015_00390 [Bacteroidota bacterium]|nr:hypothetical protein [Bacteroidota bacterium]